MAYSLAVLAVLSVITWLFLKRKTERAPFSNTFLKSGMGFDEVVIFILLLAALYNVFLLALPPTREALIGRLAALLVSKQYLRLDSELRSIRTMSEFSDIYHYYYGWYLRNNLHVGDPDSQFRQVPESSSLYFDAQKTRILHANSFFSIDRREHARRLGMILSDFEKSRLADSSLYFYAALLKNFPNFEEEHVEGLYRRFMARNGRHFSLADFGVRMQGRQGSFDIFRIADAVPTYFFFQTARVIAFDRSGRSPKRDSCLVEARRQLSLLGPAKICWHFRSSFGAEKLCRHLVGVVRFPSDPAKRDAASNAFLVPDESEFTVRIEAGDGKEILLMVRAVTGV